jgi:hypothetical protein
MCADGGQQMSKPRYESRLQVWVTNDVALAYEKLADGSLLAVSDHIRIALANHLQRLGVGTPAPSQPTQQNGKHPEQKHVL